MTKKTAKKSKEVTNNEIGEMLTHVVKHMATKEDVERLDLKIDGVESKIASVESNLSNKIRALDSRLGAFENHEVDKRLQLEVRVHKIEKKVFSVSR
jgi:outer membrane protein TolC